MAVPISIRRSDGGTWRTVWEESMEQRVRNFLQPTKEAEERIASIHVAPHNPGVSPSFYESFTVRGTRVESADHGVIRCSFRVAPGYTVSTNLFLLAFH